jgi:pimeloyl-ACP methyl ester carboxylesterase
MISVEHTVLIFRNIPHAQLWVMPNAGHATLRDHPEEFNQKVDEFFTKPFKDRK